MWFSPKFSSICRLRQLFHCRLKKKNKSFNFRDFITSFQTQDWILSTTPPPPHSTADLTHHHVPGWSAPFFYEMGGLEHRQH